MVNSARKGEGGRRNPPISWIMADYAEPVIGRRFAPTRWLIRPACFSARRTGVFRATPEELKSLDDADRSGIARARDVEAAFLSFRRR